MRSGNFNQMNGSQLPDDSSFWWLRCSDFCSKSLHRGSKMRRFIHILSFLAVALFLLFTGSTARASGIDPRIDMGGGGTTCPESNLILTGLSQSFEGVQTGCVFDVTSTVGTLSSLTVMISNAFVGQGTALNLSCGFGTVSEGFGPTSPFSSGTASEGGAGNACTFSGPPMPAPSPITTFALLTTNGTGTPLYGLELGAEGDPFVNPATGLPWAFLNITLSATVPEPGTLLLLGAGLVALIPKKKRFKAAEHLV
jgi:PEP-CTERM motif-containing protein